MASYLSHHGMTYYLEHSINPSQYLTVCKLGSYMHVLLFLIAIQAAPALHSLPMHPNPAVKIARRIDARKPFFLSFFSCVLLYCTVPCRTSRLQRSESVHLSHAMRMLMQAMEYIYETLFKVFTSLHFTSLVPYAMVCCGMV